MLPVALYSWAHSIHGNVPGVNPVEHDQAQQDRIGIVNTVKSQAWHHNRPRADADSFGLLFNRGDFDSLSAIAYIEITAPRWFFCKLAVRKCFARVSHTVNSGRKMEEKNLEHELQTVYILTNPAMPGIVKIGMTRASDAGERIAALGRSSAVPLPFDCVFACNVPDARRVEQALHLAFAPDRINPSREFFRTKPSQVVAILELLHQGKVVTAQVEAQAEAETDPEALESAAKDKRKMRPKIDYLQIGLKVGDVITFRDGVTTATITGPHTVSYKDEESSLQRVSLQLMPEIVGRGVASKLYWSFNGQSLADLYEEFHGDEE
jgi:hypothetical protein